MRGPAQPEIAALLEREPELERLRQAVADAAAGTGSVVALEGEAGIGKTTLLAHARRIGADAGMRVLGARGGELERDFAYGIVRQLFEAPLAGAAAVDRERWLAGAAGLAAGVVLPSASAPVPHPPASDVGSVLHGLYWLSVNASLEQPLLLAIDDAHWADDVSAAFLSYLARRVDELAILIVYASRVGEGCADALPAVIEPALAGTVLRPASLSQAATAQLVAQQLGSDDPPPSFSRACHTATDGNPFLLGELLRALRDDGIAPDDASTARVAQIAPRTVARATLARLRRLGPAARALAFAVAVLGSSAELRHAAQLAELDVEAAAEAADALAAASILREGRPLEFIHPIVRTTIYAELASGRRAASHKRAARLLAADGASDVAIAPHLLAADPSGDPWVAARLRAAAEQVVEQAPAAACTYLERAHREPPAASERLAVLLALGRAQLSVRSVEIVEHGTAIEHLTEVVHSAQDPAMRFDAARVLVGALTLNGRMNEAMELGHRLLGSGAPEDGELALRLEGEIALVAQFSPGHAKAALARLDCYKGKLTGATRGERLILTCQAFGAAHGAGTAAQTAQLARLALADGRLVDEHVPGSAAMYLAIWGLIYADLLDEAGEHLDRALDNARRRGWEGEFAGTSGTHCQLFVRQGRLVEAETEGAALLALVSTRTIARAMLLSCLMETMIERAEPRTWQPFLVEHALDGDLAGQVMGSFLLYSRGHLRLAAGDAAAALDDFEQLQRRDEQSGLHTPAIPSRAPQALAQLQLGDHDAARELAAAELAQARGWGTPSALACALRTAGLATGGDEGIELLREAARAGAHSPARLEHARSLTELGAALRRAGHRSDARGPLREGLDVADRCGALRLAARAREELLATGARPRRPALHGRDALTPSERRVAQLAADGLGNREIAQALFVTLRTVEGHLTQTYMKLAIGSRDELAAALAASDELRAAH
jgi:DNA-binding NarL/FixJ family response regulator